MKQLFENWRSHVDEAPVITEISFDDAKKRLKSKALTKWIKGMAFDEEMRVMTLTPVQIASAVERLEKMILSLIPRDLTDNQKGTSLEWIISNGINDPERKNVFYNVAIDAKSQPYAHEIRMKGDLETYWHTHDYSERKDIFSLKTWGALTAAMTAAKSKFDAAQADKVYKDPEKGIEVFRDDDKWRIYALHNKGAACHYGKGTEWCTAAPGLNFFEEYYEPDDPLFYFESKEHGNSYFNSRWQIHFGSEQFMDENDHEIDDADRDELIEMLGETDAMKKYPIVRYWVERSRILDSAYNENTTDLELMAMADKFAGEGENEILEAIIRNPNVTVEILKFIIENDDGYARLEAINHEKLPIEAKEELANSEDGDIRYEAASTGELSTETLTRLSEDEYWRVRGIIAKSEKTPPEALAKLVSDEKYEGVVNALLQNKSLPSELFEPILKRAQEEDAKGAVKPYKTRAADGDEWRAPPAHFYWNAQIVAAGNPQAPEELLRTIVADSLNDPEGRGWHIRSEVARNPSTPLDLLQALAKDETAHVRNPAKRTLRARGDLGSLHENFKRFLK